MREAILGTIGNSVEYTKNKLRFLETLGYENGTHRVRMVLGQGLTDHDFVDVLIGARPSIEMVEMETSDVRFGLPLLLKENLFEGPFRVSVSSQGRWPISITNEHGDRVEVVLDVFAPPSMETSGR